MDPEPGSLAEYFNSWYADMTGSPVKDQIQQRHLGLPPGLLSTSLLGWDGMAAAVMAWRSLAAPGRDWWGWTSPPKRCARPASTPAG
jgi:hypothetical protein